MTYLLDQELLELEPELLGESDWEFDLEDELEQLISSTPTKVNRKSPEYVRWVQRSLNQIIRAGLVVDGIFGPLTRAATCRFQKLAKILVDGIVGPQTEKALIKAGASKPPGTKTPIATGTTTLRDLHNFSRRFVRKMIADGRSIDCADLAIELWIVFGARYGIPVQFEIWDARQRRWLVASSGGVRVRGSSSLVKRFSSTSEFVRYVQRNLGARGLVRNTYPVVGGHRSAIAGDVFLWKYQNNRTARISNIGHTQIIDRVVRSRSGVNSDRITIAQGNLPASIPILRTYPASYFYRHRAATIGGEPHTGILVGNEPRRFNAFRHLS